MQSEKLIGMLKKIHNRSWKLNKFKQTYEQLSNERISTEYRLSID